MSTQDNQSSNPNQKVRNKDLMDPFGYPVYEDLQSSNDKHENKDNQQKATGTEQDRNGYKENGYF